MGRWGEYMVSDKGQNAFQGQVCVGVEEWRRCLESEAREIDPSIEDLQRKQIQVQAVVAMGTRVQGK